VQSVLGPLQLERAYYHCSSCGHGFYPRDKQLGIENTSFSAALTRMVGTVGAMVSFQEGSELLQDLAGVAVDPKQVARTAEALGKEIAEDELAHRTAGFSSSAADSVPRHGWNRDSSTQRGTRGPHGQATRRVRQDRRGETLHHLECGIARCGVFLKLQRETASCPGIERTNKRRARSARPNSWRGGTVRKIVPNVARKIPFR